MGDKWSIKGHTASICNSVLGIRNLIVQNNESGEYRNVLVKNGSDEDMAKQAGECIANGDFND
jgi:hypothetical protein